MSPLKTYAKTRDEQAFCALVDGHLSMVFGTAIRRVGDRELAEEVAQNVFSSLALNASKIRSEAALPAWLHRAAVFESAKVIRGEVRRKKRMEKLVEITSIEGDGVAAWRHAQADLDEAIDDLPAADRDIIFQRFYAEKSIREISRDSGKSEAAVQKRASRSIEKLRRLMRVRGFAVPSTVLAAGLGAELCRAVPTGLAASISSAALGVAVSTNPALISLFGFMSIKKTTASVAMALALIGAFTAGGYVVGRNTSKAANDVASESGAGGSVPGSSRPPGAALSGIPAKGDGATIPARDPLRELLLSAADLFSQGLIEQAVDELSQLGQGEHPRALREVHKLGLSEESELADELESLILVAWGKAEGAAAAEFVQHLAPQALGDVYRGWSTSDSKAPIEHCRGLIANRAVDSGLGERLLASAMTEWIHNDPAEALAELAAGEFDEQMRVADRFSDRVASDRARYLDPLAEMPRGALRTDLIAATVRSWASDGATDAATWLDTLEFDSPVPLFQTATALTEGWFELDPTAAMDWLWSRIPESERDASVTAFVRDKLAKRNPEVVAGWLEEHRR